MDSRRNGSCSGFLSRGVDIAKRIRRARAAIMNRGQRRAQRQFIDINGGARCASGRVQGGTCMMAPRSVVEPIDPDRRVSRCGPRFPRRPLMFNRFALAVLAASLAAPGSRAERTVHGPRRQVDLRHGLLEARQACPSCQGRPDRRAECEGREARKARASHEARHYVIDHGFGFARPGQGQQACQARQLRSPDFGNAHGRPAARPASLRVRHA
jgi:hypothetical protein